jgi:hydroxysqualene dehydroxylase
VFDRTSHSGLGKAGPASGQYLAVSLSAADDYIDMPTAALREKFLPELAALLPRMRAAVVRDFFVTRERHATFRPAPGTAALRPAATTAAPGLFLAGAYTATGWPATMEGAVRSGEAAAAALLDSPASTGRHNGAQSASKTPTGRHNGAQGTSKTPTGRHIGIGGTSSKGAAS